MAAPTALALLLVCVTVSVVQSWTGQVCTTVKVRYETLRTCRSRVWGVCLSHVTTSYPWLYWENICCYGWRDDSGNQNCNIPICTPSCQNGGTCIAPNTCQCPTQNTGQFCDHSSCSHLSACYPGTCSPGSSQCNCTSGFSTTSSRNENCLTIEDNRNTDMKIYQMQVRMSYWPRGTTSPNESHYIMADSTERTDMDFYWSNQRDFNRLETNCSSQFFMPNLPLKPDYIGDAGFGVVIGRVEVWLSKRPVNASQPRFSSLNNTFPCDQPASNIQPVSDLYQCNLYITNFDRLLEHGDFLMITFRTEGGGFRELLDRNYTPPRRVAVQTYRTINNNQSVEFRFDFKPPYHCDENNKCRSGETILDVPDITKVAPLRISWIGWVDDDSKMYRYSMEVFKMTRTTNNSLEIRVDRALQPLVNREVFEANYTTQEYTPPEPGMYSIILEAGDRANNTKYVRRLCLYDPNSQISLDPNFSLYVASASDAANYTYQSSLLTPVSVNWTNYFRNVLHEDNAFLGEVLEYPTQLENGKKNIPRNGPLDDHQGRRTVNAIPNKRGIINFKAWFAKDHDGGRNQSLGPPDPTGWTDLGLNTTFTLPLNLTPNEADTVTVWVKATDAMGNERIERTQVTFDTTPPVVDNLTFYMNVPAPGVDFSSVFDLTAKDKESGIAFVLWTFSRGSGDILYQEKVPGIRAEKQRCSLDFTSCNCTPTDHCFYFNQSYSFSNCHLMVKKENLSTANITVTADVTNMAGLFTRLTWTKQDITELNGTRAYFPPQNVNVSLITSDSVMMTWTLPPCCFKRTGLWVIANDRKVPVHKDETEFFLTGLNPDTVYIIHMVMAYEGDQMSESKSVSFKTAENSSFTAGSISGIIIGLLILAAMITFVVLFVLWRKGKVLQTGAGNKGMKTVEDFLQKTVPCNRHNPYKNNSYAADHDDIYQYPDVALQSRQTWQYDKKSVTLVQKLNEGKFATIYTAIVCDRRETVAVKMLKRGFSKDDARKMTGKINFFATRLGQHEHVLKFIGAVIDHPEWGPTLIMEYCEEGQLDVWLVHKRGAVNEDVMENLYRFSKDIAHGMQYLASKKIVHNRLAARNILMKAVNEVRIAGFASECNEDFGSDDKPQAKAKAEKKKEEPAKIPIKWVAPEVLRNEQGTEKSDVWSYGILLWEIFSLGLVPYSNIHSTDLGPKILGGYRMDKPDFSDDTHYQVMRDCWQYEPDNRPTFHTIHSTLCKQFANKISIGCNYDISEISNSFA